MNSKLLSKSWCKKQTGTRFLYLLFFFQIVLENKAQTVPGELYIGNLKIVITESARRQIQGDVDRLTASQTYYGILVDRMNLYFPVVEEEFEKAGVPKEIMFLTIQESALISDAVSSANAVGFWQFKDFTAREMEMRVDRQIDDRMNIRTASRGAAGYLNQHNFFYKNWQYAVTAYNTGRGTANKTYAKESNFGAKKMTVDKRTHWYFKKFLAHVVAFTPTLGAPHSEGIWLKEVTDAEGKTLAQIAKEEKVALDEVKKYNKWLRVSRVPSDREYSVFVPKTGSPPSRAIAEKLPQPQKVRKKINNPVTKKYPTEIAPGYSNSDHTTIIPLNGIPTILAKNNDDLHTLSAKGGISEKKFRKYNDMGPSEEVIQNKFYYIKKKKGKSKIGFHIVQNGETLWDVSQKYGIQMHKLAKKNRMSIIDEVKEGRVLWLSKTRPATTEIVYHKPKPANEITERRPATSVASKNPIPTSKKPNKVEKIEVPKAVDSSAELKKVKIHTVAKGESLWAIAKKYKVSVDDLLRWNEVDNANQISIGQNILVKPPIEEASADKSILTHTVSKGDTLYSISRKYGMTIDEIMDLNKKSSSSIDLGETLKVYRQ